MSVTTTLRSMLGRNVDLGSRRAIERSPNWVRRQAISGPLRILK